MWLVAIAIAAALELYVERDHQEEWRRWYAMLESIQERLSGLRGVSVDIIVNEKEPESAPVARVNLDEVILEMSTHDVVNELMAGDPSVAVSQSFLQDSALGINPIVLQPDEDEIIVGRIRSIVNSV